MIPIDNHSLSARKRRESPLTLRKSESFNRVSTKLVGVASGVCESLLSDFTITVQKTSAIKRLIKPFVGIQCDRVGLGEAAEFSGHSDGGKRSVCSVDVQPNIPCARDCSNLFEWIYCTGIYRPADVMTAIGLNLRFVRSIARTQFRGDHAIRIVTGDVAQIIAANAKDRNRFGARTWCTSAVA